MSVMYKVKPLNRIMLYRNGEEMYLEKSKAERLQRRGLVKIIGAVEHKPVMNIIPPKKNLGITEKFEHGKGLVLPLFVPYVPGNNLGYAYNEAMTTYVKDWVLFIDHDLLLINPHWYDICMAAINSVGHDAGWITCYTNRIGCKYQIAPSIDRKNNDVLYHRKYAKDLYIKNRGSLKDVTDAKGCRFSGFFMLTHKKAWEAAGKFNERCGLFGVDVQYCSNLKTKGYRLYIMQDLYVYHAYFRDSTKKYFQKEGGDVKEKK